MQPEGFIYQNISSGLQLGIFDVQVLLASVDSSFYLTDDNTFKLAKYEFSMNLRTDRSAYNWKVPKVRIGTQNPLFFPRVVHLGEDYWRIHDVESWVYLCMFFANKNCFKLFEMNDERGMFLEKRKFFCQAQYGCNRWEMETFFEVVTSEIDSGMYKNDDQIVDFPFFFYQIQRHYKELGIEPSDPLDWEIIEYNKLFRPQPRWVLPFHNYRYQVMGMTPSEYTANLDYAVEVAKELKVKEFRRQFKIPKPTEQANVNVNVKDSKENVQKEGKSSAEEKSKPSQETTSPSKTDERPKKKKKEVATPPVKNKKGKKKKSEDRTITVEVMAETGDKPGDEKDKTDSSNQTDSSEKKKKKVVAKLASKLPAKKAVKKKSETTTDASEVDDDDSDDGSESASRQFKIPKPTEQANVNVNVKDSKENVQKEGKSSAEEKSKPSQETTSPTKTDERPKKKKKEVATPPVKNKKGKKKKSEDRTITVEVMAETADKPGDEKDKAGKVDEKPVGKGESAEKVKEGSGKVKRERKLLAANDSDKKRKSGLPLEKAKDQGPEKKKSDTESGKKRKAEAEKLVKKTVAVAKPVLKKNESDSSNQTDSSEKKKKVVAKLASKLPVKKVVKKKSETTTDASEVDDDDSDDGSESASSTSDTSDAVSDTDSKTSS
uniref:Uncharacterized protein n=1 Tax=Panagrolaimus sp. JU765 TaxID=591449 RepID=A0AC34QXX8_9BILA